MWWAVSRFETDILLIRPKQCKSVNGMRIEFFSSSAKGVPIQGIKTHVKMIQWKMKHYERCTYQNVYSLWNTELEF